MNPAQALATLATMLDLGNDPELTPDDVVAAVRELREQLAGTFSIVPVPGRRVQPDAVVVSPSGKAISHVLDVAVNARAVAVTVLTRKGIVEVPIGLDDPVRVLMPTPTREAVLVLREVLGPVSYADPVDDTPTAPVIAGAWRDGQVHLCPLSSHPHVALRACVAYAIEHGDREFIGDRTFTPDGTKQGREAREREGVDVEIDT